MTDLYVAAGILAALSLVVFRLFVSLSRRLPQRVCDVLAAASVLLIGFYIRDVWDKMFVAEWLPVSSLIVLGNWFPLAIGALAGIAWVRVPPPFVRKLAVALLLASCAVYSVYFPFRGAVPECHDKWVGGVCQQTTTATCSAASAATLLRHHGIPATEQEMAELCVTRKGTSWWGLYRGLKLKTAGTEWDVQTLSGTVDELRRLSPSAAILFVRLTAAAAEENPVFEQEGWIVGTSHAVVLFRFRGPELCDIGDPSSGPELWSLRALTHLYEGRGLRLVPRERTSRP